MVMVLVGILSAVFAFYIREAVLAWGFLSGQKSLVMASRGALNKMVRELKTASQMVTYTTSEVSFINTNGATVTFVQTGPDLYRGNYIILQNLKDPGGLGLTYLDQNGNQTALAPEIKTIWVELNCVNGANKFTLKSAAHLRQ